MNNTKLIGSGPRRVIVFSGWMGGADEWGTVFDAISPDTATFALVDYPGYGRAKSAPGPFSFARHATEVVALADDLGWDRFVLMGHSMGGVAIQRVLLEAPQRVAGLIGIAPVPASSSRMDAARLGFFESAISDIAVRQKIFGVSTGNRLSAAWLSKMAKATQSSIAPDAMRAYLHEWATVDFSDQVRGNPVPVQLFIGEHDPTLSAALMKDTWLSYYPNAALEIIGNAGHYPMYEAPAFLGTRIEAFLNDRIPL
jgi:pimeloyl-ACP methyl ester carboxylesterase